MYDCQSSARALASHSPNSQAPWAEIPRVRPRDIISSFIRHSQ
ncbi:uncharacterized protein CTRU02_211299 [Colletotrichum truncatum]|uniref:Uncharacterized protein n=1 Tax=Colletotrichum truncatum TaxID=5467 RepID=A0ACC3YRH4_COLTU|nr:uncharacterized protein CTRU02_02074 [Colletotrichum truncatum]KAF6799203.1 hypothetical protein CTRU02_02074 [Colletotrichum truncatum]